MKKKFDIAVIGSGPGGYPAAIRCAQRGKKVALIEAGAIGGTCLNRGCIPSKALIAAAEVLETVQHAEKFGITTGPISFDYSKMVERKDQVVAQIQKGLIQLIASNGIEVIKGKASFISPKVLEIQGSEPQTIEADKIIIASGSEPRSIQAFPFDGEKIIDSTDLLNLNTLPKKIVIIGGGVIGAEFASLFSLLGVNVTVIEMLASLLPMEAPSVSSFLARTLIKRGVQIETNAEVKSITRVSEGVEVLLASGATIKADIAAVAVGRKMNLDALNLNNALVKLKSPSQVEVNNKMETTSPGIYAVGDIASKWWLAHVATHQGIVAADNACGVSSHISYEAIPNVIFTSPEIATVGISFEEATKNGLKATLSQFPMKALGKSVARGLTEGFSQVVVEEKTGKILGAQVVGDGASILISEMAVAIQNELTIECIGETIHAHPTLSEGWMESAFISMDLPIHLPPKRKLQHAAT